MTHFITILCFDRRNSWAQGHYLGENYITQVFMKLEMALLQHVWLPQDLHVGRNCSGNPSLHLQLQGYLKKNCWLPQWENYAGLGLFPR